MHGLHSACDVCHDPGCLQKLPADPPVLEKACISRRVQVLLTWLHRTDIITNPISLTYSFLAGKMLGEKSETRATICIHHEKKW